MKKQRKNLMLLLEQVELVWLRMVSLTFVLLQVVVAAEVDINIINDNVSSTTTTNTADVVQQPQVLTQLPLQQQSTTLSPEPPKLSGQHFLKITTVDFADYTHMEEMDDGTISFSGFLVDILREISRKDRANFTYELLPPSGFGSGCGPIRLNYSDHSAVSQEAAFDKQFWHSYNCAESDVNDKPYTNYTTDMYWGLFFVTPKRQKVNQFTVALDPPGSGALSLLGPLTGIEGTDDLLFHHPNIPLCGYAGTAFTNLLNATFPNLNLRLIYNNSAEATHQAFEDGLCEAANGSPNLHYITPENGKMHRKWQAYRNNWKTI